GPRPVAARRAGLRFTWAKFASSHRGRIIPRGEILIKTQTRPIWLLKIESSCSVSVRPTADPLPPGRVLSALSRFFPDVRLQPGTAPAAQVGRPQPSSPTSEAADLGSEGRW